MVGAIRAQQSICQHIGGTEGSAIPGKRLEILLKAQQRKSTCARTLKFDGRGNSQFTHSSCGSSPSRVLGSAQNSPQSPQRSPVTVFRPPWLLPLAFVTQAVSEPFTGGIKCKPQEGQIPRGKIDRVCWCAGSELLEKNGHDQGASVVIRRVTFRIVRNHENRMLDDSRLVCHPIQVIQLYGRKPVEGFFRVLRRKCGARISQSLVVYAFKTLHIFLRYAIPHHLSCVKISAFPHGMPCGVVVQKFDRFCDDSFRIVKRIKGATLFI